jgi:hypothetical protein
MSQPEIDPVKISKSKSEIDSVKISKSQSKIGVVEDDPKCTAKSANLLLANMIRAFHTVVVIFVLLAPFSNIPAFLVLHITFSISLLVHWYANNNECSLSYIESKLRGLDRTESFTHQFVAPMYDMSKTEWSRLCYIITIVLMCISIYYLYNSKKVSDAMECWRKTASNPDYKILPFYKKIGITLNCFKPVLVWC